MTETVLTPLETAAGIVLPTSRICSRRPSWSRRAPQAGHRHEAEAWRIGSDAGPLAALEAAMLPALRRPPCLVSFSGGRDSAAVLAAAVRLARREGLSVPIPATNRFPGAPAADETRWQEIVVRHLGLDDWLRVEHDEELDLVGPYAQRVLRCHGLLWPANAHFHLPLLELAAGGSLLTGLGGDELFAAAAQTRVVRLLRGEVALSPRALLSAGLAASPMAVRRRVIAHRGRVEIPWLRPAATREVVRLLAGQAAAEPRGLTDRMRWWQQLRYLDVTAASLQRLAAGEDVRLFHPLRSTRFWRAVAVAAGPAGFVSRRDGMGCLFGSLLPSELITRRSKANFDQAFWTSYSADFTRGWNGSGVPTEHVDVPALAAHWRGDRPRAQSATLLQAAWMASAAGRLQQAAHHGGS